MGVVFERKILIVVDNLEAGLIWESAIKHSISCSVILGKTNEVLSGQLTKESLDLILVEPKESASNEITICQKLRETTIIPLLLMNDKFDILPTLKLLGFLGLSSDRRNELLSHVT